MSELWSEDIRDSEFGARSQTINDDYVHLKGNLPPNETEEQFTRRFLITGEYQDAFERQYDIADDIRRNKRVILKTYASQNSEQEEIVLQNLINFEKLNSIPGVCKILSFCTNSERQVAAFEYDDRTVEECVKDRLYQNHEGSKVGFYLNLMEQLANVVSETMENGIDLQDLNMGNVIAYQDGSDTRYKVLYNEMPYSYNRILNGTGIIYWSHEKLLASINEKEDEYTGPAESVFQIGLLLLDVIYRCEKDNYSNDSMLPYNNQKELFQRDEPVNRARRRGYHKYDNGVLFFDYDLIKERTEYLFDLQNPVIDKLIDLIRLMIAPIDTRIALQHVQPELLRIKEATIDKKSIDSQVQPQLSEIKSTFQKMAHDNFKNLPPIHTSKFSQTGKKISVDQKLPNEEKTRQSPLRCQKEKDVLEAKQSLESSRAPQPNKLHTALEKKAVLSTTTTTTDMRQRILSQKQSLSDWMNRHRVIDRINPSTNESVMRKLTALFAQLQNKDCVQKEYYDRSVYYGEVDNNHKRRGLGIYMYVQDDIYFGNWIQNRLLEGVYIFKNGETFEGLVKSGKRGYGIYHYNNGNRYEGEWVDDLKCGHGKMYYSNKDTYEGPWLRGKKEGAGIYTYANGTVYEGGFRNGRKYGLGVIRFPNGAWIEAMWDQTHIEGPGKAHYPNGDYYEGNFHCSEKQGDGVYIWDDDCRYEGKFMKDMLEGEAKIFFTENEQFIGRVKNGRKNNHGKYLYNNGDEFVGEWKDDEKVAGIYRFSNGDTFDGRFKRNQLSFGIMTYANGQSYQGEFQDGLRSGLGRYCAANGDLLFEGIWRNDILLD